MYAGMPGLRNSFPVFADDPLPQALPCPGGRLASRSGKQHTIGSHSRTSPLLPHSWSF